jgi:uncharacterized membrane protein
MLVRLVKSRPRLSLSFLFGVLLGTLLPGQWSLLSRVLLGWNAGVWCYLGLMFWLMKHASATRIEELAEQEDRADLAIVAIMSIAATASLVAIVLELTTVRDLSQGHKLMHYLVTVSTVAGSWLFIATIFTFHYAKIYYRSPRQHRALQFPDANLQPNYWDFLYFSFTIAVAAQTSDVALASRPMRKTALAQSVLSFWFNMAVLGLSINIAAGLIGT